MADADKFRLLLHCSHIRDADKRRGGQGTAKRLEIHVWRLYGGYEGGNALPLDGKGPFVYNPVFHILLYGHGRI